MEARRGCGYNDPVGWFDLSHDDIHMVRRRKLTKKQRKTLEVVRAISDVQKSGDKLEIARFRRRRAQEGNLMGFLFGKPKRFKKRKRK